MEGEWKGGSEGGYYKLREEWAEGGREGGRERGTEGGMEGETKGGSEGVYYKRKGERDMREGGSEGGR